MPKKIRDAQAVPTLVLERLQIWGRAIRTQRVRRRIPSADLCARMDISDATLRRIERGDPGVNAAAYLTALWVLGILDTAAPLMDASYWQASSTARASRIAQDEDDDF